MNNLGPRKLSVLRQGFAVGTDIVCVRCLYLYVFVCVCVWGGLGFEIKFISSVSFLAMKSERTGCTIQNVIFILYEG